MIFEYTYDEFPESTATTEGMKVIQGDPNNIAPKIEKLQPIYAIKEGKELRIKFIFPTESTQSAKKYPLLVFIQGSAWKEQSLNNHVMDLFPVVKAGIAVAIIQYRSSLLAPFPAQVLDTKSAVRYLLQHAAAYPLDMDNVFLSGDSSGGHTALCCLATWQDGRLDEEGGALPVLRGCIDFYGPTHLEKMTEEPSAVEHVGPNSPEGQLLGGFDVTVETEMAYNASPISYFYEDQDLPPLLMIHGSKDRQVPFAQSVLLYDRMKDLGINDVELYQIKGADHGGSLFWGPETANLVIDFVMKNCCSE